MSLLKLEPTNLYLSTIDESVEGYTKLGTFLEYDFDFDIKPYIKEPIVKGVTMFNRETEMCTHYYDYIDDEYCFMFNESHTFQSLLMKNDVEFDEDIKYVIFTK